MTVPGDVDRVGAFRVEARHGHVIPFFLKDGDVEPPAACETECCHETLRVTIQDVSQIRKGTVRGRSAGERRGARGRGIARDTPGGKGTRVERETRSECGLTLEAGDELETEKKKTSSKRRESRRRGGG